MPGNGHESPPDAEQLLAVVGDVCGLLDIEELRQGMLASLRRALASGWVSLNEVTPDPAEIVTILQPDAPPELFATWAELAHENPLLRHYLRTQDGRAYRFSDVIEREELEALPLYRELYAPMEAHYQIAFTLPAAPDRVLAIALSRAACDYSDEERDFVNRARPFLIQAYLNAIAFASLRAEHASQGAPPLEALRAAGLTKRESEVLHLLALGRSNHHIAAALGISYRTVGKHLEHAFRKLGVGDRSSAAGRVWELAGLVGASG
jgi:DNA-binding CsgD family transcriptional regulator